MQVVDRISEGRWLPIALLATSGIAIATAALIAEARLHGSFVATARGESSSAPPPVAAPDEALHVASAIGDDSFVLLESIDRAHVPAVHTVELVSDALLIHRSSALVGALDEIPAHLRGWIGRAVIVDGDCAATVTDVVLIAEIAGEPAAVRASGTADDSSWTRDELLAHGRLSIAGRLDRCGDGIARAATAPRMQRFLDGDATPTELDAVRRLVLASPIARAAGAERVSLDSPQAFVAPRSDGQWGRWFLVRGTLDLVAGAPTPQLWALARIEADGTATLIHADALARLDALDGLAQLDGSTAPVVLARVGFVPAVLSASGRVLAEGALEEFQLPPAVDQRDAEP